MLWLLRLRPGSAEFVDWLDTRGVAWPGQPERIRDTVAWMGDLSDGGPELGRQRPQLPGDPARRHALVLEPALLARGHQRIMATSAGYVPP